MVRTSILLAAFALCSPLLGQPPSERPAKLSTRIQGFNGESYRVDLTPGSATVVYQSNSDTFTGAAGTARKSIEIPPTRWAALWKSLDEAKVWSWRKDYASDRINPDPTEWSVEIRWCGRTIIASGIDAYPDPKQFKAFEAAISELVGGLPFK
jgi:hypothetical protein